MPDYVPSSDQDYAAWLYNLVTGLNDHLEDLGLDAADILPLQTEYTAFSGALTAYNDKKIALTAATNLKKDKRGLSEITLRPLVQRVQHAPGMTDELRGELGLPVRSGRTTHSVGVEVPKIYLETEPGSVSVHFGTEPANEKINGKPLWAKGCLIYRKRADEENFQMVAWASTSPYLDTVEGQGADYTYYVRYRGTKATDIGQGSQQMTVAARGLEAMAA
jgi:hypothetical protein